MSALTRLAATSARLGDRINPIVVKEARQAVRSRALLGGVFLLIAVLVLVSAAMTIFGNVRNDALAEQGAQLFGAINGVLLFFGVLITPVYIGVRFAGERTGPSADLMHTTTLRPSAIVLGKLAVAGMLAILLVSVAAPFLALTYLLRGIDLPTIGFYVAFDLFAIFLASMVGVFVAALPISTIFKSLIGLAALPFLLWFALMSMALFSGFGGFSVTTMGREEWTALAVGGSLTLATAGALVCIAIAMSAPRSSNRAVLPRVYLTLFWATSLVLVYWIDSLPWMIPGGQTFKVWFHVWVVVGSFAIVLATAERRTVNARLRRSAPKSALLSAPKYFFTTGAAPGMLWAASLVALCFIAFIVLGRDLAQSGTARIYTFATSSTFNETAQDLQFVPLWLTTYALLAVFLRERVLARWAPIGATPMMAFILAAIGSLVPFIIAYGRDPYEWDRQDWPLALNPFGPIIMGHAPALRNTMLMIVLPALAILLLLNAKWILRQIAAYRPLTPSEQTDA